MKLKVHVTLKNGVLDPQGKPSATRSAASVSSVNDVRIGHTSNWCSTPPTRKKHASRATRCAANSWLIPSSKITASTSSIRGEADREAAVIVFPGSNCDRDAKVALKQPQANPSTWCGTVTTNCPKSI